MTQAIRELYIQHGLIFRTASSGVLWCFTMSPDFPSVQLGDTMLAPTDRR